MSEHVLLIRYTCIESWIWNSHDWVINVFNLSVC